MSFQCTLVTPEQLAAEAAASQVILPAHDGLLGILTNRAPLLVKLGTGPLRIDRPGGQSEYYFIDGGVAQMNDNKLTILTNEAIAASQIDYDKAREEYEEAAKMPATDPAARELREHRLMRAREKQRMVHH